MTWLTKNRVKSDQYVHRIGALSVNTRKLSALLLQQLVDNGRRWVNGGTVDNGLGEVALTYCMNTGA